MRWFLCVAAVAFSGCQSFENGAREQYASEWSCPAERLTVVEREGVTLTSLLQSTNAGSKPPADIAADPERLAMWTKTESDKRAAAVSNDNSHVFDVKGCDRTAVASCYRRTKVHFGQSSVKCSTFSP